MKIYTKTGDDGTTGLFGGPRVAKNDPRIEAYGTIDELNALLGVARAGCPPADLELVLARTQHELFELGAELATPDAERRGFATINAQHIERQEREIDRWQEDLAPLTQFILPGGSAATLHLARTVCRRAERRLISLAVHEAVRAEVLIYINRLSDWLFVLARLANHRAGFADPVWQKPVALENH